MRRHVILAALGAAVLLTACGGGDSSGSSADAVRRIEITMVDTAFRPPAVEVDRGTTVRFVFVNDGKVAHDAFVGDAKAQADHEREMRQGGDAHDGHGGTDDNAITVEPGETGELVHTFERAGTFQIGCHQAGHYDAGMTVKVTVS